jgi:hypothetical protein
MEFGKLVKDELSGSSAKSYVAGLTKYHRIQASPMMRDAANHVRDELLKIGVEDVAIEEFVADGRRKYWTYRSSIGWDVRGAELRLVEPKERLLADFADVPQSLHTFSAGTPEKGVTAELVDVGKGLTDKDYAGKKVKGKMVLATGLGRLVQREAVIKRGAVGVVTDTLAYEFPGVRESVDVPDAHSYQGLWPDAETARKLGFGFSLSRRQGNELRKYLHDGKKVKLNAKVDADLKKGKYCVVTAVIRGSSRPDEEVFLTAHLCHPKPSANDNASGSGLLMEIARTIVALTESGRIDRPKRSIRFLWVPETVGTAIYLSQHPMIFDRIIAGINLDMVGEDQELCKSTLCMDSTPDSLPSYLNDLVYSNVERSNAEYDSAVKLGIPSRFRCARTGFSGGSDHAEFNESTVCAPCVSLTQWPDLFYHTSMDTMDKVSEESLRRVGWAVAVSALTLADADREMVHELACLTASEGIGRISRAVGDGSKELHDIVREEKMAGAARLSRAAMFRLSKVQHVIDREIAAVRSLGRLDSVAGSDDFVECQAAAVEEHGLKEMARFERIVNAVSEGGKPGRGRTKESEAEKEARRITPRRRFKGTLDLDTLSETLGEKKFAWYKEADSKDIGFSKKMYEVVNLSDGRRTLHEIVEFVTAEFGPTDHRDVIRFVSCLKEARLVSY